MSLLQILFLALNLNINVAYFETSENITIYQEEQLSTFPFFEKQQLEPRILVAEKKGKRRRGEEESEEKTTMITNII